MNWKSAQFAASRVQRVVLRKDISGKDYLVNKRIFVTCVVTSNIDCALNSELKVEHLIHSNVPYAHTSA